MRVDVSELIFLDKKRPVPKHGSKNSIAASLGSFTNLEHLGA
jgi:hypothetical protein